MNRVVLVLAVIFSMVIGTSAPIMADEDSDNQEAQRAADEINAEAENNSGRASVVNRFENEFAVDGSVINDLRSKKMGYGEIGIALSLAQQMPGGITNENIQKVMDLRQGEGKTGWGNVAKQLNLNLGKAVSQTKKMTNVNKAVEKPDVNQSQAQGVSEPKFQKPVSAGKPADTRAPGYMRTPGGAKGKK